MKRLADKARFGVKACAARSPYLVRLVLLLGFSLNRNFLSQPKFVVAGVTQ